MRKEEVRSRRKERFPVTGVATITTLSLFFASSLRVCVSDHWGGNEMRISAMASVKKKKSISVFHHNSTTLTAAHSHHLDREGLFHS